MRTCPNCHTQYTDDTLRFCLQDGAQLDATPVTQQPTVSFTGQEVETSARVVPPRGSEATQWQPKSEVTRVLPPQPPSSSGSKTVVAVAITVAAMVMLFGVVGIAAWIYFKGPGEETGQIKIDNQNVVPPRNLNSNGLTTPLATPAATPSPTPVVSNKNSPAWIIPPTPQPQVDKQQASREVSQQVHSWRSLAESGDLNAYMGKYAGTVDYYRKRGATADFVRRDKQRAFNMFSSMSVGISNMNVTVDDSGDGATAVFDKEWVFEGSRRSTGKVRQQMQFRRIGGQWLITAERDLKVYYTN